MSDHRTIAVVTGSRAEFGLLRPVLAAIDAHDCLDAKLIVCGLHLLPEVNTVTEISQERAIAAEVPMQEAGKTGRAADAQALGRGICGLAEAFVRISPDVVLVLGDRIEAFAAAAAASVGGFHLAHLHGGDRAEGIADEAMRHAITKLAHVHLPATAQSASRIQQMGELPASIHVVGSPAVDGIDQMLPLSDEAFEALDAPRTIFLMHGVGETHDAERARARDVLAACAAHGSVLALAPNRDAGSDGIRSAIQSGVAGVRAVEHLPRAEFVGALKRVDALVGNSSAGLIEASVVGCPAINIGARQKGRERAGNVHDLVEPKELNAALARLALEGSPTSHPYGDGRCGERVAAVLAAEELPSSPRKCSLY